MPAAAVSPSRSGNSHEFSLERLYAYLIVDDIEVDDSLIAQARNGDGLSLRKIADIYYKRNEFRKAKEWYHLSAIQNDRSAFYRLGMIYQHGRGVLKNYQQSMLWYLRAHENGCAAATNNIGTLYDKGHGMEKDYGVAFHWYSEAALKGSKIGFYNLGVHYENGLGVEKDMLYVLDMYQKSADKGHYKALNNIDRINKGGVHIGEAQLGRLADVKKLLQEKTEIVREMKQTYEPIKTKLRVETEKNEDLMEEIRKMKTEISYYKGQAGEFEKLVILNNEQTQRIEHMERKNKESEQKYNENEQKYKENEQKMKELEEKNRKAEDENEDLQEVIRKLKQQSIKPQPVEPEIPTEASLSLLD